MKEKLCVFCKHFEFNSEYTYYSTLTGGDEKNTAECGKGLWSSDIDYSMKDFREKILSAEGCAQFELPDDVRSN